MVMPEAKIIDRGRGPEIAGTRITVYTILECLQEGWRPDLIAFWYRLGSDQVEAAIRYIDEHKEEVARDHEKIMERINRGNSAEVRAKLDAAHQRLLAMTGQGTRPNSDEVRHERHSGG
jgi:uncharacterized protein (DUF433 family)